MVSWGGSRCRHSRFGSRPTPAAKEILPGFLLDEPFQLQFRERAERLVRAKLGLVGEDVHMDRPRSLEELPHLECRTFERLLQGYRCGRADTALSGRSNGVRAAGELLVR